MGAPKGQKQAIAASEQATKLSQQQFQQQQDILNQIKPFATALMGLGMDPTQFLQSALGQSILGTQRQGVSENFAAARNNLLESLAGSGLAGSGVGIGPLANLFGQEAGMQANLIQQLPQLGLNLGLQGANVLQGQQGMLNPLGFLQTGIQGFNTLQQNDFLKAAIGAAGQAAGGLASGGLSFGGGGSAPPRPISGGGLIGI